MTEIIGVMPFFIDPAELALGVVFIGVLALAGRLIMDALTRGLDEVCPPLERISRRVPKEMPRELEVDGVVGQDNRAHFVIVNSRRWPRFRQRVLLRIDDESAPWVWVTAYTAPEGSKRFDYNLDD